MTKHKISHPHHHTPSHRWNLSQLQRDLLLASKLDKFLWCASVSFLCDRKWHLSVVNYSSFVVANENKGTGPCSQMPIWLITPFAACNKEEWPNPPCHLFWSMPIVTNSLGGAVERTGSAEGTWKAWEKMAWHHSSSSGQQASRLSFQPITRWSRSFISRRLS